MSPSSVAHGFKQVLNKQSLPNLLTVTSVVFWFLLQPGLFLFWYAVGVKWSNSGKNESSFVSTFFSVNRLGVFSFPSTFPCLSLSLSACLVFVSLSLYDSPSLTIFLGLYDPVSLSLSLCVCFKDGELWWLRFGDECLAKPSVPFLCSEMIAPYLTSVQQAEWDQSYCWRHLSSAHACFIFWWYLQYSIKWLIHFFKTSFCCLPFF